MVVCVQSRSWIAERGSKETYSAARVAEACCDLLSTLSCQLQDHGQEYTHSMANQQAFQQYGHTNKVLSLFVYYSTTYHWCDVRGHFSQDRLLV